MEMLRAVRLIVDTGIYSKCWPRGQAVQFSITYNPIMMMYAKNAIDRYIASPGQVLSYISGEIKILELKALAKEIFGDKFDIKSFYDELLKDGRIPLPILKTKIRGWITEQI
jgi:uncharacterized protein (DUF885 family)